MDYTQLASETVIKKTVDALTAKGIEVSVVDGASDALTKIKEMIPTGASVMNGASKTLESIGFVDYLKSEQHGWKNLHKDVIAETDPVKQSLLRKHATISDYYLGSVHALTQTGDMVIASNTGSQLPSIVFNSTNLIFVVGTQKIVSDLSSALDRLETYVVPLENENMMKKYGFGTQLNKILIFKHENPMLGRKVRLILVKEPLGF